uniref:RPS18.A-like protein n=1 Tax=Liriodendron tulipifera TaxID=3415 RepID=D9YT75_LIRTU|nr:RPS18.A-like protein [Liriodendron tulipifera]
MDVSLTTLLSIYQLILRHEPVNHPGSKAPAIKDGVTMYIEGFNTCRISKSLIANEDFQHILRVLNTNVDGKQKIMFALTSIKGIGRRFANIVCKGRRRHEQEAGELSAAELENLMVIVANPDSSRFQTGFEQEEGLQGWRYSQVVSNALDMKLRDDWTTEEDQDHRGLRHYWGLRVRGQHTKTTGRRGKTVGVSKKR